MENELLEEVDPLTDLETGLVQEPPPHRFKWVIFRLTIIILVVLLVFRFSVWPDILNIKSSPFITAEPSVILWDRVHGLNQAFLGSENIRATPSSVGDSVVNLTQNGDVIHEERVNVFKDQPEKHVNLTARALEILKKPIDPPGFVLPTNLYAPMSECSKFKKYLALVTIRAEERNIRNFQRRWFAKMPEWVRNHVSLLFSIGRKANDVNDSLVKYDVENILEAQEYNDMIIGNYLDSYGQLSIKTIMSLMFPGEICSADYELVIKVDGDLTINWPAFIRDTRNSLETHKKNGKSEYFWEGAEMTGSPVIHARKHKNFEDLPSLDAFPTYMSGIMYVLNKPLVDLVLRRRREDSHFYNNEDAMIGMLLKNDHIKFNNARDHIIMFEVPEYIKAVCGAEYDGLEDCDCTKWWAIQTHAELTAHLARRNAFYCPNVAQFR